MLALNYPISVSGLKTLDRLKHDYRGFLKFILSCVFFLIAIILINQFSVHSLGSNDSLWTQFLKRKVSAKYKPLNEKTVYGSGMSWPQSAAEQPHNFLLTLLTTNKVVERIEKAKAENLVDQDKYRSLSGGKRKKHTKTKQVLQKKNKKPKITQHLPQAKWRPDNL